KASDAASAEARIAAMERTIRERLGQHVWGADDETLGQVIGRGLARRSWRVATAESLSAGDVARTLVDAPGAREWFAGGTVRGDAASRSCGGRGARRCPWRARGGPRAAARRCGRRAGTGP